MSFWSSDELRLAGANMEGRWNGIPVRGFQKIDLSDEVARDIMYGNGSEGIGVPPGTYKGEFTIESIPEEVDDFLQSLGDAYYQVPGSVSISLVKPSGLITYNISNLWLMKTQISIEAGGQKGSSGTLTGLMVKKIDWNGISGIRSASPRAFSFPIILGF